MKYERDWIVPARNLSSDFHLAELDVMALACRQASALDRVDNGAGGRIADDTTGLPVSVCASGEVVRITVKDSVPTNDIRGESWVNVKLAIFDERVGGRIGSHLKFIVPTHRRRSLDDEMMMR